MAVDRMNTSAKARAAAGFDSAESFEQTVAAELRVASNAAGIGSVRHTFHPSAFPDILVNGFGVEVKFTQRKLGTERETAYLKGCETRTPSKSIWCFAAPTCQKFRWRKYEDSIQGVRDFPFT